MQAENGRSGKWVMPAEEASTEARPTGPSGGTVEGVTCSSPSKCKVEIKAIHQRAPFTPTFTLNVHGKSKARMDLWRWRESTGHLAGPLKTSSTTRPSIGGRKEIWARECTSVGCRWHRRLLTFYPAVLQQLVGKS